MPPKLASDNWRPVQIKSELTITGGKVSKSYVLSIDKMMCDAVEVELVQVSSADHWLCEMATGQTSSRRPLGRSCLFKLLKNLVIPAVAGDIGEEQISTDKMQDLAFDGDKESPEPSEKNSGESKGVPSTKGSLSSGSTFL